MRGRCKVCHGHLYEDESASVCRDCEAVCKRVSAIHRGEDTIRRRRLTRIGAAGLRFGVASTMSHDNPGHEDRMRAHQERVQRDLAELELQTIIKRRKRDARHAVDSAC
jgi:hypothetical protein